MAVPREVLTARLEDGSFIVVSPVKPRFCVGGETKEDALQKARLAFSFAERPKPSDDSARNGRITVDRPAFQLEELVA